MREIKFRLWLGGQFTYWGFVEPGSFAGLTSSNVESLTMDEMRERSEQFTGLHDKNGKEIYEGDVVRHPNGVHPVVWDDSLASWQMRFSDYVPDQEEGSISYQDVQVIGNIHENPELLK